MRNSMIDTTKVTKGNNTGSTTEVVLSPYGSMDVREHAAHLAVEAGIAIVTITACTAVVLGGVVLLSNRVEKDDKSLCEALELE